MSGVVDVNGVKLYADLQGPADAPCVVLSNSLATDHTLWDANVTALTQKYRVLRYDTRGHGRSAVPHAPYTMEKLVRDVLGLLRHFEIQSATLAGVSLGGLTALAAAQMKLPQIAAIVVCDARADFPPEAARGMDDRAALVREQGIEPIVPQFTERWLTKASFASRADLKAKIGAMIRTTSAEGLIGCQEAIKGSRIAQNLGEISVPALFVIGDQDVALTVDMMRAMADRVTGADMVVIPGAGHLSNLENPDAFNAALLRFLDGVG